MGSTGRKIHRRTLVAGAGWAAIAAMTGRVHAGETTAPPVSGSSRPTRAGAPVAAGAGQSSPVDPPPAPTPAPPSPSLAALHLDQNENPLGPSPSVLRMLAETREPVRLYPDPACTQLEALIAMHHRIDPECVVAGAGSTGVLSAVLATRLQDRPELILATPTFDVLRRIVAAAGARLITVDHPDAWHEPERLWAAAGPRTGVVYVPTPHNPMGPVVPARNIATLLGRLPGAGPADPGRPGAWIVIDEAYIDYVAAPASHTHMKDAVARRGIVVLRTFSKAYGMAGLRIGYGVAHPDTARAIRERRLLAGVSSLAWPAVLEALEDRSHLARVAALNVRVRRRLLEGMRALGLRADTSDANFCRLAVGAPASRIRDRLALDGVLVNAPADLPDQLRITTGTEESVERVLGAIARATARRRQ